jgi:hypothetical protein
VLPALARGREALVRYTRSGTWSEFATVSKEYRESGTLPDQAGVIIVDIEGVWSIEP